MGNYCVQCSVKRNGPAEHTQLLGEVTRPTGPFNFVEHWTGSCPAAAFSRTSTNHFLTNDSTVRVVAKM